jgi:hypothetical protein
MPTLETSVNHHARAHQELEEYSKLVAKGKKVDDLF